MKFIKKALIGLVGFLMSLMSAWDVNFERVKIETFPVALSDRGMSAIKSSSV